MRKELEEFRKGGFFFEIEEGSNYKVYMTYEKTEVITFEQFLKLANAMFKGGGDFITINKTIVQKRDIRMIEPTKEATEEVRARRLKEDRDSLEKLVDVEELSEEEEKEREKKRKELSDKLQRLLSSKRM